MTSGSGLRERKKQQTRQLIAETARRLFLERGFDSVTVADVAREADVAIGTVFNYFPTKEDLVYGRFETFEQQLLGAIRERPRGETVLAAFRSFILEARGLLAAKDEAAAQELVAVTRMITASPALLAREQQILARYTDALAQLIADETRAAAGDVRPYVVANALIGVHRSLLTYVRQQLEGASPNRQRLARETRKKGEQALALLAAGLDDYAAKR